jgi:hypothetical protein
MQHPHPKWDDDPVILERIERVGRLRLRGKTIREIATALDVPPTTVGKDVQRLIILRQRALAKPAAQLAAGQLAGILEVRRAAWETYEANHANARNRVEALNTIIKTYEREAKLTGTDAPTLLESDVTLRAHAALSDAELAQHAAALLGDRPLLALGAASSCEPDGAH